MPTFKTNYTSESEESAEFSESSAVYSLKSALESSLQMQLLQYLQQFGAFLPSIRCGSTPIGTRLTYGGQSRRTAALTEPSATQNCQFSGISPASRQPYQRKE